jgi:hypothetical protein
VRSNVPHAGGTLKEKTVWHCEQAVQDRTLLWKPMEKLGSSTSTERLFVLPPQLAAQCDVPSWRHEKQKGTAEAVPFRF